MSTDVRSLADEVKRLAREYADIKEVAGTTLPACRAAREAMDAAIERLAALAEARRDREEIDRWHDENGYV